MSTRHISWLLAVTIASMAVAPARAGNLSFTTNSNGDERIQSCSDLEMTFWRDKLGRDDIVTARRSQTIPLGASVSKPLRVEAPDRGGVFVQPSTDGNFSALVCMAGGATSDQAAGRILDGLNIEYKDGVLRVSGSDSDDWGAEIVLSVPPGSTLDLSATNGQLHVSDVDGRFTLRTTNGPIKLTRVSGVVDARADNGPIKFRGHSGDVTMVAQNGPLDVELDAREWTGKRLDGSTQNGPIKLRVPDDLKSGVEVTCSRSSPTKWNGAWQPSQEPGAPRSYHFGGDRVVVRLSTVNGPMKITGPKPTQTSTPRGVEI